MSGRSNDVNARRRRTFTKLLRDKDATVRDIRRAKLFVDGMDTFESKAELLAQLADKRNHGMRRIRDVLSLTNSVADVETLLVPFLGQVMTPETNSPTYRPLRDKILYAIYDVPGLILQLHAHNVASDLSVTPANRLCGFLRALTKAFLEPRQSELIWDLAKKLRERGDVDEAGVLCTFLFVDKRDQKKQEEDRRLASQPSKPGAAACWVTDMVLPGGRHDNDHQDFRHIRVLPTVEELKSTVEPYLPLASGGNKFIEDPVASLLDGNFRLLREDAVSMMKGALSDESERGTWKNARIVDLDVSTKRAGWTVSFVVQCDSRHDGNPSWERDRVLMHGSVVALCREGTPIRMGTISIREYAEPNEWLKNPHGPKIGIMFESQDEFDDSIRDLIHNSGENEQFCGMANALKETPSDDPRRSFLRDRLKAYGDQMQTFDLVEVSKSFFSYQPILQALQDKDSVPLSDELVGLKSNAAVKPEYLPNRVYLPTGENFGNKQECFLDNWSTPDIVKNTSLDASQAEALRRALTSKVALLQGPPGTGE